MRDCYLAASIIDLPILSQVMFSVNRAFSHVAPLFAPDAATRTTHRSNFDLPVTIR